MHFHMIVPIVFGGGNDPYDRDNYMETRLYFNTAVYHVQNR